MWQTTRYNFEIIQGQSVSLLFKFETANDVPINLTGWSARAQLADSSGRCVKTMTATIQNPAQGQVLVYLSDEETGSLPANKTLIWDLALENPSGDVEKPMRGNVSILCGATLPRS